MSQGHSGPSPTFASLFCGCGGFDLGFAEAGFQCSGAFDIDPLAIAVYRRNLKRGAKICDLSTVEFDAHALRGLDVLIAGSPCQGFSTAGKRNYKDPRNYLLLTAGQIAVAAKPKVFLAENVRGVISGSHRKYWDRLHRVLREAGYQTHDIPCDAYLLGVPQIRKRIVLVAWCTSIKAAPDLPLIPGGTLRDALGNLSQAHNHHPKYLTPLSTPGKIAPFISQGQKLCNVRGGSKSVPTWKIPDIFGRTTVAERDLLETLRLARRTNRVRRWGDADPVTRGALQTAYGKDLNGEVDSLLSKGYMRKVGRRFDLTRTFNGKFRRLDMNKPSLTVDTRFGDPRYFLHPTEDRGFTVREAARIQGFPDHFVFEGPERAQYRMIGNAVPPPMAAALANIAKTLLGK